MSKCDNCGSDEKLYPIFDEKGNLKRYCWKCFKEYYTKKKVIPISKIIDEQMKIPKINLKGEIIR